MPSFSYGVTTPHLLAARRAEVLFIAGGDSSAEYVNVPASAIPVKEEQPLRPPHPYEISKVSGLARAAVFLDHQVAAVNIRLFNIIGPGKTNDAPSDFVRQLVRIKGICSSLYWRSET